MSKQSKSVRKDTITITLGPKTAEALAQAIRAMEAYCHGIGLTETGHAGCLFFQGLEASLKLWKIDPPADWTCCLD